MGGYSTTKMVEELREELPNGEGRAIERIHTCIFSMVVCAIFAWISDSLNCDAWQNLPFGLPYPQLHASVWHNFMLVAVLGLVLIQVQYRQVFQICGGNRTSLEKNPRRGRVMQSMVPFL